jgi:hypothetical protein
VTLPDSIRADKIFFTASEYCSLFAQKARGELFEQRLLHPGRRREAVQKQQGDFTGLPALTVKNGLAVHHDCPVEHPR